MRQRRDRTANVGKIISSNSISGEATVERYINTGTGAGQHPKSWQFLATPTRNQSVYQSWQENGGTPAGYGTIVTGTGSGFDVTTVLPSVKYFDPTVGPIGDWVGITNTADPLYDQRGYMTFVRGDRTVTTFLAPANPTNMRSKGILFQPSDAPPQTNVGAGALAAVGNPYASAIDLDYMVTAGSGNGFTNLTNDVSVWDPLLPGSFGLGGYQTLSSANSFKPTAGGTTYYMAGVPYPNIQSGQAFFVLSSGSAGTVKFTEDAKLSTSRLVNRTDPSERKYFRATLHNNSGAVTDGNAVVFDSSYSSAIDADDAIKLLNPGENFMIIRANKRLSVEARDTVLITDTVFYDMKNVLVQTYQIKFAPENMYEDGLSAYLIDNFEQDTTVLNLEDSNFVNFTVTSDTLSYRNRFYVVFMRESEERGMSSTNVPITANLNNIDPANKEPFIGVYPNPIEDRIIRVHFSEAPKGTYQLQLVSGTGQKVLSRTLKVDGVQSVRSIELNKSLAAGNYRLSITGPGGIISEQQVLIK